MNDAVIALPAGAGPIEVLAVGHAYSRTDIEAAGLGPAYAAAETAVEALVQDALRVLAPAGVDAVALRALIGERIAEAGLAWVRKRMDGRGRRKARPADAARGRPELRLVTAALLPELLDLPARAPGPPVNPVGLGRRRIRLRSGRMLNYDHYHQYRTYSGVLCGYPQRSGLRRDLERVLRNAGGSGPQPILVPPRITAYAYPPEGGMEEDPCEALPPIVTVATFHSDPVAGGDWSSAQVVWFQHDWGLPPPELLEDIAGIRWEAHAEDESW